MDYIVELMSPKLESHTTVYLYWIPTLENRSSKIQEQRGVRILSVFHCDSELSVEVCNYRFGNNFISTPPKSDTRITLFTNTNEKSRHDNSYTSLCRL